MEYVKTAHYKELAPMDEDFLYIRAAAIVRTLLVHQDRDWGVERLATKFGGKKRAKGASRSHKKPAAKGIIRHCLKELEKLGYVQGNKESGGLRRISPVGQSTAYGVCQGI